MSKIDDVIDSVLEEVFVNGDGSIWADDINKIIDGLGLPISMYSQVAETLEEIAYNREVAQAFEGNPGRAFAKYVDGDGSLDSATVEMYMSSHAIAANDALRKLRSFGQVFGNV